MEYNEKTLKYMIHWCNTEESTSSDVLDIRQGNAIIMQDILNGEEVDIRKFTDTCPGNCGLCETEFNELCFIEDVEKADQMDQCNRCWSEAIKYDISNFLEQEHKKKMERIRKIKASIKLETGILTIEEAIEHAKELAGDCTDNCSLNHMQLATWLEQLHAVQMFLEVNISYLEKMDRIILDDQKLDVLYMIRQLLEATENKNDK